MVMESRRKLARKISSKAKPTTGEATLRESNAMYGKTPKQIKRSTNKKSTKHDTQKEKKPKTPITKERGKGGKAKKKSKSTKKPLREKLNDAKFLAGPLVHLNWSKWYLAICDSRPKGASHKKYKYMKNYGTYNNQWYSARTSRILLSMKSV